MSSLFLSLTLLALWLVLFIASKRTRREQLIISAAGLFLSPGALMFALLSDVDRTARSAPTLVGIEDFLAVFCFCGIAAVGYEILTGKREAKPKSARRSTETHWLFHLVLILSCWIITSALLLILLNTRPLSAFVVGGVLITLYIIMHRRDLLADALLSGAFMSALLFILETFFFVRLFPEHLFSFFRFIPDSTLVIRGIPLEELLWAAAVGFTLGPLYEYVRGIRLKS